MTSHVTAGGTCDASSALLFPESRGDSCGLADDLLPCVLQTGSARLSEEGAIEHGRSLELVELLLQSGMVRFRAQGTCMYPAIKPNDLLHLTPKRVCEIAEGEITLVRKGIRFYGHRAVRRGETALGPFLCTRPDHGSAHEEGPFYDADVLGVVDTVERRGRLRALSSEGIPSASASLPSPDLAWFGIRQRLFRSCLTLAAVLQKSATYRKSGRLVLRLASGCFSPVARLPWPPSAASGLSRKISGPELETLDLTAEGRDLSCWTLSLRRGRRVAATIGFQRAPAGCPATGWWWNLLQVRTRYGGLGLERVLFDQAERVLRRSGETHLYLGLPRESAPNEQAPKELGFAPTFLCRRAGRADPHIYIKTLEHGRSAD